MCAHRKLPWMQCPGALNAPEDQEVEVEVPLSTFWRSRVVGFLRPERWRWVWARLLRHGRAREAREGRPHWNRKK
eukprot:956021-Prymnesium_polylepis.1